MFVKLPMIFPLILSLANENMHFVACLKCSAETWKRMLQETLLVISRNSSLHFYR